MTSVSTLVSEASPDTWGIPGREFALVFLLALIGLLLAIMWVTDLLKGRSTDDATLLRGLEPERIALLTSEQAAVATALASLSATWGRLSTTVRPGELMRDVDVPLRVAVANAYGSGRARSYAQLQRDPEVRAALEVTRADLRRRGLLLSPLRAALLWMRFLPLLALTLLGIARIVTGYQHHKPLAYITVETIAAAFFTVAFVVGRDEGRGPTHRAGAALGDLRRESRHLHPTTVASRRASTATARAAAPMSVALFGTAALLRADPQLAATLDIPAVEFAAMPPAGAVSGSSSTSSNSSSCNSGSSCGGGGGCGG